MTGLPDPNYQPRCEAAASRLVRQALWPVALVVIAMLRQPLFGPHPLLAMLEILVAGAVTALSALLLFDALLFRLMASHPNDEAGGAAVDDLLARMRLKPRPATTRPLQSRIDGSNRLLLFQRMALAAFAVVWLAATRKIA